MSPKYEGLVEFICRLLKAHHIDTVGLSVPFPTINDRWLRWFLRKGIIPHVEVDRSDTASLTERCT